jgi:hypothetical protein
VNNTNREVDLIKMDFCKFKCPFKDKSKINKILETLDDIMDNEDLDIDNYDRDIVIENFDDELKYLGCELCPLDNFINRLEEEKIIKE